jgi:hypothetical protein
MRGQTPIARFWCIGCSISAHRCRRWNIRFTAQRDPVFGELGFGVARGTARGSFSVRYI